MTDRRKEDPHVVGQTPVSGFATTEGHADDPMTDRQGVILRELADRAGEPYDGNLNRKQAEERIAWLREQLGEGE
jgi:hypothetical protein